MARSNIVFTIDHKIKAHEFIENSSGVSTALPFDANTTYTVHVKSLTEATNLLPASVISNSSGGISSSYYSGSVSSTTKDNYTCYQITSSASNGYTDGIILKSNGSLTNGSTYTLAGWVWVPSGTTIRVRMRDSGGGSLAASSRSIAGSSAWVYFSKTFTVSNTTTNGCVESVEDSDYSSARTWYIRNLSLTANNSGISYNSSTGALICSEIIETDS